MKILLTGFPTVGGSGLIATKLGVELSKLGHDVHFVFYKRPFFLSSQDAADNITFHQIERPSYALFNDVGSPFTIQSASAISEIVKEFNIDILHSHYAIPHAVSSYLASKLSDVITVVTTHGSDTHTLGSMRGFNPIVSMAMQKTDRVTSVSNFLARETEQVYGLPFNSVDVVYDFIDTDQFKPSKTGKKLKIIQASNFRPVKRIPRLIEIFGEVSREHREWSLDLIGNGPDYPIAKRKVRSLNLQDKVNFLGVTRNVPQLLSEASILLSASSIESFGLTLAEAMASETAVCAPRVGGIPEVCLDMESGVLYDPKSNRDAIEKLSLLMDDSILRSKIAKEGRKRVCEHFDTKVVVSKYEDLYFELIDRPDYLYGSHELYQ